MYRLNAPPPPLQELLLQVRLLLVILLVDLGSLDVVFIDLEPVPELPLPLFPRLLQPDELQLQLRPFLLFTVLATAITRNLGLLWPRSFRRQANLRLKTFILSRQSLLPCPSFELVRCTPGNVVTTGLHKLSS